MSTRIDARTIFWPLLFMASAAYIIWEFPEFIVFMGRGTNALNSQNPPANLIDFVILAVMLVSLVMGIATAATTVGEGEVENRFDKIAIFAGRITMLLIAILVAVMFFEVMARYIFERPTLWANELSLWLAGFIFLLSGLYAMQQRSHIRIFLLYDAMPRWLQRICDSMSSLLILMFSVMMIYGGYNEAHDKFWRWETFGTAFDPPIPATLKPALLLIILLVAIQALVNLVTDWNKAPEVHTVVDEDEIQDLVKEMGAHLKTGKE